MNRITDFADLPKWKFPMDKEDWIPNEDFYMPPSQRNFGTEDTLLTQIDIFQRSNQAEQIYVNEYLEKLTYYRRRMIWRDNQIEDIKRAIKIHREKKNLPSTPKKKKKPSQDLEKGVQKNLNPKLKKIQKTPVRRRSTPELIDLLTPELEQLKGNTLFLDFTQMI